MNQRPNWPARPRTTRPGCRGHRFRHVRGSELADSSPACRPASPAAPSSRAADGTDPMTTRSRSASRIGARRPAAPGQVVQLRPDDNGVIIELGDGFGVCARGKWSWPRRMVEAADLALGDDSPLDRARLQHTLGRLQFRPQAPAVSSRPRLRRHAAGERHPGRRCRRARRAEAAAPNFRRADAMLKKAAMFMPCLATTGGTHGWVSPVSLPDRLPAIGYRADPQHYLCFGHGPLG